MDSFDELLGRDEQAIMRLRSLYRQFGYKQYKMSRFEEYELYADNKTFLASGEIITFTGAGGKLMALRPDVTLSIVKNTKDDGKLKKLYYNENVFRHDGNGFKEQTQVGLECIGPIDINLMSEVLALAWRSLEELGGSPRLDISHMGYIGGLLKSVEMTAEQRSELLRRISSKNASELGALCNEYGFGGEFREKITALAALYDHYDDVAAELRRISVNEETDAALCELEELYRLLERSGLGRGINLDFSIVNDLSYYSGIIFHGFLEGIPVKILSGGRYDKLLRKFGNHAGAIGFAVYLDLLERLSPAGNQMISVALPKGRLGEKAYAIFEAAGYGCPDIHEQSRRLVFDSPENGVRYFWVKPSDVAIYVERGAADIGIVGKDILLEYSPDVYELLDLGIGKCRVCVAAEKGFSVTESEHTLRVATKFPNIARDYYGKQGRDIDVIGLNGSIELAPLLGLSDVIVDIVETGKTLLENNLEPIETIVDISARLISNKVSYKFNHEAISKMCSKIAENLSDCFGETFK
ncbi:MAG: ATP phosphoribosyltransferase [Oscillospiraceae bacterium]|nr:ATP phosphoribosyltransferase [Oscillospiraceae bacterium]